MILGRLMENIGKPGSELRLNLWLDNLKTWRQKPSWPNHCWRSTIPGLTHTWPIGSCQWFPQKDYSIMVYECWGDYKGESCCELQSDSGKTSPQVSATGMMRIYIDGQLAVSRQGHPPTQCSRKRLYVGQSSNSQAGKQEWPWCKVVFGTHAKPIIFDESLFWSTMIHIPWFHASMMCVDWVDSHLRPELICLADLSCAEACCLPIQKQGLNMKEQTVYLARTATKYSWKTQHDLKKPYKNY